MMFATLGYMDATSRDIEPSFEKVAIYANKSLQVTHAARQISAGLWTSKLGRNVDVSHTLEALEGGIYGTVAKILKRGVVGV